MDESNKIRDAASQVAGGVRDAAGVLAGKATEAVDALTGKPRDPEQVDVLRAEDAVPNVNEVNPDPGNKSSVRDTAGDTTDHA